MKTSSVKYYPSTPLQLSAFSKKDQPLKLTELQPGSYNVTLRLDNYESVSVSFSVTANETKTIQTNLVALSYTGAMQAGRRYLAAADFDHAIESLDDALRVQPNDPVATTLQREATGRRCLQRAKALGEKGDYIAGGLELKTALTLLPDNEQAKRMVADFKQHEPEQLERERVERLNRGKKVFAAILQQHGDADLFESYELKTTKPVKEVEEAIVAAFQIQPALPVTKRNSTAPETFFVETAQEYSTFLATSAGRRQCLVVGAQTRDDETQILYKVLEFKTEAVNKFSIGAVLGTPVEVKYVPIHPSRVGVLTEKFKTRLKEGVSNVTARIQGAIGQPPTGQPTIPK